MECIFEACPQQVSVQIPSTDSLLQSWVSEMSDRQCFVESGTRGQINDSINGFIEQGNEGLSIKIELLGLKQSILVQTRI